MKRKLMKIGTLNTPNTRWLDALEFFSQIHVICLLNEKELDNPRIIYHKIRLDIGMNNLLYRIILHSSKYKALELLSWLVIFLFRIFNINFIREIRKLDCDEIHSSYNDFDESALLTLMLGVKNNYTRAQKETRMTYSFLEFYAFKRAKRIVFNSKESFSLFKNKYGDVFNEKKVILSLDEDVRGKKISNEIIYDKKYSEIDGKIHAVILAGRVLSTPNDSRSGGRLYYIPIIKKLIQAGIIVHLHAGTIVEINGENPYKMLADQNNNFFIEKPLDFIKECKKSYSILSRYDVGILHAHIKGTEVSSFDAINLPHRYFEYELAHVAPIDIKGKNKIIDRKAKIGFAIVIDDFSKLELKNTRLKKWDTPNFATYIEKIYE